MQKGFPFYVLTVWVMEKPPLFQFWIPLTTRNECLVSHINWSTWSSIILNFRMLSPARVKSWSNLLPVFSEFFFFSNTGITFSSRLLKKNIEKLLEPKAQEHICPGYVQNLPRSLLLKNSSYILSFKWFQPNKCIPNRFFSFIFLTISL